MNILISANVPVRLCFVTPHCQFASQLNDLPPMVCRHHHHHFFVCYIVVEDRFSFIILDLIACRMWITITWISFIPRQIQNHKMNQCKLCVIIFIMFQLFEAMSTSLFDGYLNNVTQLTQYTFVYHSQLMRRFHSSFYQCFKKLIMIIIPLRNPSPMDSIRSYSSNLVHQAKPWIRIILLTVLTALSMSIGNCHHCEYKFQSATLRFMESRSYVCNDNFLHFEPLNCVLESSHSYRNGFFYTTQI